MVSSRLLTLRGAPLTGVELEVTNQDKGRIGDVWEEWEELFRITIISIFFSPLHNNVINREWKIKRFWFHPKGAALDMYCEECSKMLMLARAFPMLASNA